MINKATAGKAICSFVAALSVFAVASPSQARAITGGHPSAAAYSFMGSLQRLDSPRPDLHVCGVELIAPRWALTAGHCTRNAAESVVGRPTSGHPLNWTVRFGSTRVDSGGQSVKVTQFTQLNNRYFVDDLALLRLARPVLLEPIQIADAAAPPGKPVRILGWGETCENSMAPRCTPHRLREADTLVQPPGTCRAGAGNFCVGSRNGAVGPQDFDSGGPAIVMQHGQWRLVGTVEGGGGGVPSVYTSAVLHRGWIDGYVSGRTPIPADTPFPTDALDGTVRLDDGCVGSVIRGQHSRPSDPAMVLTAGHCLHAPRHPVQPMLRRGGTVIDRADREYAYVENRHGDTAVRATTTKVLYATMTGTDIAVLRLDDTYAELMRAHVHVFSLAAEGPRPGGRLRVLSATGGVWNCRVQAIVPELSEGGYHTLDAIRYRAQKGCDSGLGGGPSHGDSGAPLVDPGTGLIVGLHATSNDEGRDCAVDNPCEISSHGVVASVKGRKYGEQTAALAPCLAAKSRLVLSRTGCSLTARGVPAISAEDLSLTQSP